MITTPFPRDRKGGPDGPPFLFLRQPDELGVRRPFCLYPDQLGVEVGSDSFRGLG
jgi:hypothetical protein